MANNKELIELFENKIKDIESQEVVSLDNNQKETTLKLLNAFVGYIKNPIWNFSTLKREIKNFKIMIQDEYRMIANHNLNDPVSLNKSILYLANVVIDLLKNELVIQYAVDQASVASPVKNQYNELIKALESSAQLYTKLLKLNQFDKNTATVNYNLNAMGNMQNDQFMELTNINNALQMIRNLPEYSAPPRDMTYPEPVKSKHLNNFLSHIAMCVNANPQRKSSQDALERAKSFLEEDIQDSEIINYKTAHGIDKNTKVQFKDIISKYQKNCEEFKEKFIIDIDSYLNRKPSKFKSFDPEKLEAMRQLKEFISQYTITSDYEKHSEKNKILEPFSFMKKCINALAITAAKITEISLRNTEGLGESFKTLVELFNQSLKILNDFSCAKDAGFLKAIDKFNQIANLQSNTPPLPFAEKNEDEQIQSTLTPEMA
ncbi:MAG: hypothetical protein EP298_10250 [Gammaproteobacteria bacterium]|nr:MAG: hypothetical protein EP298_10250 [Gammaproteobacteria bacterium]UTW42156.1 hypothetical protein KFE69_11770 [bacterium SCSIO 12844]